MIEEGKRPTGLLHFLFDQPAFTPLFSAQTMLRLFHFRSVGFKIRTGLIAFPRLLLFAREGQHQRGQHVAAPTITLRATVTHINSRRAFGFLSRAMTTKWPRPSRETPHAFR